MHLIHHYKEKYEQRQQFCIDLLNKSSEAVAVLRKLHQRVKKEEDDSAKAPAPEDGGAAEDAAGSSRKSNEGQRTTDDQLQAQIDEISESIKSYEEQMGNELANDEGSESPSKKPLAITQPASGSSNSTMQVLNYTAVKQIVTREHQASNILLMERRYEAPLMRSIYHDVKRYLSNPALQILSQ